MPLNDSSVASSDGSWPPYFATASRAIDCSRLRADVVAERIPRLGHVVFAAPSASASQRRILVEPLGVFRQHAIDLRLLQHDLGHEDVVRVVGLAPRQIAAVAAVPGQQPLPEAPAIGRRGHGPWRAARFCFLTAISYNSSVKIYTRTGDAGETSLFDGDARQQGRSARRRVRRGRRAERLARPGPRVSASIRRSTPALVAHPARSVRARRAARRSRATSSRRASPRRSSTTTDVARLEQLIDRLEAELPPLRRSFSPAARRPAPALHVARTVCRRAERRIVALEPPVDPVLLRYVNRLSDLLFVLARAANHRGGVAETEWCRFTMQL